jgi:hypothetical protein
MKQETETAESDTLLLYMYYSKHNFGFHNLLGIFLLAVGLLVSQDRD